MGDLVKLPVCYGCLVFLHRWQGGAERLKFKPKQQELPEPCEPQEPKGRETQEGSKWEWPKWLTRTASSSSEIKLLNRFAALKRKGDQKGCAELLSEDAEWVTLYSETIRTRASILEWSISEYKAGRRNIAESPWVQDTTDPTRFRREMKVTFPSKATHDVVQTVTVRDGEMVRIEVKPKYPALSVALAFALARSSNDDDAALGTLSEKVVWKAWDGFHCEGKEQVRKLFRAQKGREAKREGTTEFEAAEVNETGGCFERELLIDRIDGIKVKTKQKLYVKGELAEMPPVTIRSGQGQTTRSCWGIVPKIVEVHVLTTEEMVDGQWVKAQEDDHY